MLQLGHSLQIVGRRKLLHVRNAPKATVGRQSVVRRNGPKSASALEWRPGLPTVRCTPISGPMWLAIGFFAYGPIADIQPWLRRHYELRFRPLQSPPWG